MIVSVVAWCGSKREMATNGRLECEAQRQDHQDGPRGGERDKVRNTDNFYLFMYMTKGHGN